jgi:hypothetical protein
MCKNPLRRRVLNKDTFSTTSPPSASLERARCDAVVRHQAFAVMATLGVVDVRHLAEAPGPLPRAFVPVENAVDVGRVEIAGPPPHMEGSPPRGDETDTASLRVAPYQVAGHSSKGVGLPSLVDDAGHFLKPCPDDRKGAAEVDFYRRVVAAVDAGREMSTSLAGFARFVPAYRGTFRADAAGIVAVAGDDPTAAHARTIAAAGQRAVFLRLEDVTAGYSKPCVVDLKIGLRTFSRTGHDCAYIAKRSAHDTRSGQAEVGFKICGMQTWEFAGRESGSERGERAEVGLDPRKRPSSRARRGAARDDGWLQRRRPYDWARNLRDKDAVRAALEEFVGCRGKTKKSSGRAGTHAATSSTRADVEDVADANSAATTNATPNPKRNKLRVPRFGGFRGSPGAALRLARVVRDAARVAPAGLLRAHRVRGGHDDFGDAQNARLRHRLLQLRRRARRARRQLRVRAGPTRGDDARHRRRRGGAR